MHVSNYQQFIHMSRYSRWLESEQRRETWAETVYRYTNYMRRHLLENVGAELPDQIWPEIHNYIYDLKSLPSMRALMTAGEALDRCNVAGYNCAYTAIDRQNAFREILYILMCGTGVGFSVEDQYVSQLPVIPSDRRETREVIQVPDSKEGWAASYGILIDRLYKGELPELDFSLLRPEGARLKTFGGRSSGPGPLEDLMRFTIRTFYFAAGRKLTSLEAHDIACKIGSVVVVGGVRRSALISLSDLSDSELAFCKTGEALVGNEHRYLANNSVAYSQRPTVAEFTKECEALYLSNSGERGFFNREAAQVQARKFGRDDNHDFGTNPCSEIILRRDQFCNLSTVVARPEDSDQDLADKIRIASVLGTIQSTLIDFKFLGPQWRDNCAEERLLGVSMTGIYGHATLNGTNGRTRRQYLLSDLRDYARETNQELASMLGIPAAAAVTAIKPEGTTSEMANTSSGLNPWYAPYYMRRIRGDIKDPISQFLKNAGVPYEMDVTNSQNLVFAFPKQAPDSALCSADVSAISHMETWLDYQRHYCEHKPSVTINVGQDEWEGVFKWVWDNFDEASGMAFLPRADHIYAQAPFEEINAKEHDELVEAMPKLDWRQLEEYEKEDMTTSSQEMACTADGCVLTEI